MLRVLFSFLNCIYAAGGGWVGAIFISRKAEHNFVHWYQHTCLRSHSHKHTHAQRYILTPVSAAMHGRWMDAEHMYVSYMFLPILDERYRILGSRMGARHPKMRLALNVLFPSK